ncbi:MAG: Uma2 family endonuclease [Planctomycetes bacterium]|nr:Uma2 family endonuclease [Planctomycetota bacterium]
MPTKTQPRLLRDRYEQAAQDYLHRLPLEHFMESTPQATQRKITVESLDLVTARRPEVQGFNELLVQYPVPRRKRLGQVVPDNMVVIHDEPIDATSNFAIPLQPVGPFWVLEYVSKSNRRKDYVDNMRKYERDLKVPYYLLFEPDKEVMTLYRHDGKLFVPVRPNRHGRCGVEELDIEVALLDGWVRFWFEGTLLPLPGEMQIALDDTKEALSEMQQRLADMTRRAEQAERELAQQRARGKNGKN